MNNKLDQLRFAISILGLGLGELLSSLTTLGELGLVIGLVCTLILEGLSGSLLPRRLDLSLNVVWINMRLVGYLNDYLLISKFRWD